MTKIKFVCLFLLLFFVAASALIALVRSAKYEFDVVVRQTSGERIYDVRLEFEGFRQFRFGDIYPTESERGLSIYAMHEGQWPQQVEVIWQKSSRQGEIFTDTLLVGNPLVTSGDERLQLVVEFQDNFAIAYPRIHKHISHQAVYRY